MALHSTRTNPYPESYDDYPTSQRIPAALYVDWNDPRASPYAAGREGPIGIYGAWYGDAYSIQLALRMPQPPLVLPGDFPLQGVSNAAANAQTFG